MCPLLLNSFKSRDAPLVISVFYTALPFDHSLFHWKFIGDSLVFSVVAFWSFFAFRDGTVLHIGAQVANSPESGPLVGMIEPSSIQQ